MVDCIKTMPLMLLAINIFADISPITGNKLTTENILDIHNDIIEMDSNFIFGIFQFSSYKFENLFECISHISVQVAAHDIVFFTFMEMIRK